MVIIKTPKDIDLNLEMCWEKPKEVLNVHAHGVSTLNMMRKSSVVTVKKVVPNHGALCVPSADQLVISRTKSGQYAEFQKIVLTEIVKQLSLNSCLDPKH